MGNCCSCCCRKLLDRSYKKRFAKINFPALMKEHNFTRAEVERLFENFYALDADGDGYISYSELEKVADSRNPLRERIILAFLDLDRKGMDRRVAKEKARVDFAKYVKQVAIWTPNAPPESKLKFLFRIYDDRNEGKIGKDELKYLLHEMLGSSLTERQRDLIADRMVHEMKADATGIVTLDHFIKESGGVEKDMIVKIRL